MCAVTRVMMQQLIRLKIMQDSVQAAEVGANLLPAAEVGRSTNGTATEYALPQGALTVGTLDVDGVDRFAIDCSGGRQDSSSKIWSAS